MERRRYLIYAIIVAIIGALIFGICMFFFFISAYSKQVEEQSYSASPAAVGTYCTCGGMMRESVIAATCTEDGFDGLVCSKCGRRGVGTTTPALGHVSVSDPAVAATCTSTGLTAGSHCSRCNIVLSGRESIPALGHNYTVYVQTKAPTCTATGTAKAYCRRCSSSRTSVCRVRR